MNIAHGGSLTDACDRYGGTPDAWVDLSTGINPWPYPVPTIDPMSWHRLPERDAVELLARAAREAYPVADDATVVCASGSQAIIQWLPFVVPAGEVAIVGPTYGEYELA